MAKQEKPDFRMTLVETLRRPVPVAMTAIVALTALGWAVLFGEAISRGGGMDAFLEALCRPADILDVRSAAEALTRLASSIGIWIAMSVAMMLPTASLLVIGFADRLEARSAARSALAGRSASPLSLAAGYLAVWVGVSIVAATMQALLSALLASIEPPAALATIFAGAVIGAAGFYQFSGLKKACLISIRNPFVAGEGDALASDGAAFRLGLRQGASCVGCCGALMAVLVVVGAMNLAWMAIFAAIMAAEKMSASDRLPRFFGIIMIAAGAVLSVSAVGLETLIDAFSR
jgi:predicted metal-binding membrane protein